MDGLSIGVGVLVSIIVSGYKWLMVRRGISKAEALTAVAVFSLVAAFGVVVLQKTSYWPTVLQVVVSAGAFYNYILQHIEEKLTG